MKPSPPLLGVSVLSFLMFILLTAIFPLSAGAAKKPTFANIKDLTWDGKQFIAVGRPGLVMTSPDGVRWTQRSVGQGHEWLESIAWGNGTYAMIARYKGRDCTFTSQDGLDWKRNCPEALAGGGIKRLRWANNSFIALGKNGQILVSEGGEQWQRLESGTNENLVGLAGGEKNLTIMGQDGLVLKGVFKGPLTAHQQPKLQMDNANEFHRPRVANIAWSGREFITVGSTGYGSIFARSEDGENWDLKFFQGFDRLFYNIAWGNGRFVAVGKDIAVSPDGRKWQFLNISRQYGGSYIHLRHIVGGGRRFLTTGRGVGNAFISDDGFSWLGGTNVALDPSGTTILPDKLAKTWPVDERKDQLAKTWPVYDKKELARIFMRYAVVALIVYFLAIKIRILRPWEGFWKIAGAIPFLYVAVMLFKIKLDVNSNPTSHNLLPIEVITYCAFGLGIHAAIAVIRSFFVKDNRKDDETHRH